MDRAWGFILLIPYAAVFILFVVYPIAYGVWLSSDVAGYQRLWSDPIYWRTVRNTLVFLIVGVNLKMLIALALSSFFVLPYRWVRVVGVLFILPWAVPHIPSILSIRWFLNSEWGMLNNLIWQITGVFGPAWLSDTTYAFACVIAVHIWKSLPFWTLILIAGRMAISRDLYEAATLDGAAIGRLHDSRAAARDRGEAGAREQSPRLARLPVVAVVLGEARRAEHRHAGADEVHPAERADELGEDPKGAPEFLEPGQRPAQELALTVELVGRVPDDDAFARRHRRGTTRVLAGRILAHGRRL